MRLHTEWKTKTVNVNLAGSGIKREVEKSEIFEDYCKQQQGCSLGERLAHIIYGVLVSEEKKNAYHNGPMLSPLYLTSICIYTR